MGHVQRSIGFVVSCSVSPLTCLRDGLQQHTIDVAMPGFFFSRAPISTLLASLSVRASIPTRSPSIAPAQGMGEPLNNYDSVRSAVAMMTDSRLFALRRSAVTVSTVGVIPRILQVQDSLPLIGTPNSRLCSNVSAALNTQQRSDVISP